MPRLTPALAFTAALTFAAGLPAILRAADDPPATAAPIVAAAQQDAPVTVSLRLPAGGVRAGSDVELPLRLTEKGEGGAGIPRARIKASVALPSAPDARAGDTAVREGTVAGDYALTTTFPRAGDWVITLKVVPPGDGIAEYTVTLPVTVVEAAAGDGKAGKNAEEQAASPYKLGLDLEPARPLAGESVKMTLTVTDPETKKPVTEYDEFDERPLVLYVVRDDLGDVRVEQPKWDEQKKAFTLSTALPGSGDWKLFAVTAPRGAGAQVLRATAHVDGVRDLRAPLIPQATPQVRQDGYVLAMKPGRLFARTAAPVEFTLSDSRAGAVTDLDLTGGTLAHLTMVEKDGKTFLHAHTDTSDPRTGRTGTLVFPVRFPKAGTYRGWVQFSRGGIPETLPFVVRVYDAK
jgi:hypothetical protein